MTESLNNDKPTLHQQVRARLRALSDDTASVSSRRKSHSTTTPAGPRVGHGLDSILSPHLT